MDEEPTADDVPPLQPGRWKNFDELTGISDAVQAQDIACQRDNLRRRLADQRLRDALAEENFAGARYRRFEQELAAYGISVLRGWMHSGYIFKATATLGFHLDPTEYELEELVRDSDVREELANMTVAVTLPKFRDQALVGGGWTSDGGASLPTYFVGATKYVFPNEFRQHRAYRSRYNRATHETAVKTGPLLDPLSDPAATVPSDMHVRDVIRSLDGRTAPVVALRLLGYSHEEIAELLDLPTDRAVEGILYRTRARAEKIKKAMTRKRGDSDGRA
ncbi:hypothetical protein ACQP2Y_46825 (plasmid) [Actinoplanes sp. CA-051413]|uniref:hypothetical protein n=1 Tax=Actinoplanes sp. CA-051413 TaxID=3239899 RepID=UPI003D997EA5